jgi:hypothetical protein
MHMGSFRQISRAVFFFSLMAALLMSPAVIRDVRGQTESTEQSSKSEQPDVLERVSRDVTFLASDGLEGRGIDNPGIEKAARYIIAEFQRIGLSPPFPEQSYRQTFTVPMSEPVSGPSTNLILRSAGRTLELTMGADYQPMYAGGSGTASGPIVFVGYGIRSQEDNYDDYADIDVQGKTVVLIRREPQQDKTDGAFLGTETSRHSYIDEKLKLARQRGAAAVLLVNDTYAAPDESRDDLADPSTFGEDGEGCPFIHVRRSVIDEMLKQSPLKDAEGTELRSLTAVTRSIDQTLRPLSQPIAGWTTEISNDFSNKGITTSNLIGVIEGEGPQADETIIVGAHYDHIGYGGFGARDPRRTGEIHNGADDNASGTSAVLELARRIAAGPKPSRRIVFTCFSAEEKGLIGSNFYVRHAVFPLENTVFMLNFDMIGRLRNNRVEVNGTGTATELAAIAAQADSEDPITIRVVRNPFGGSDHLPFYERRVPVVLMFTGMTDTYHTPEDDAETLNLPGVVSVINYSEKLLRLVDGLDNRIIFQQMTRTRGSGNMPYLGIAPDLGANEGDGIRVRSVVAGSPAAKAGLQAGDILTSFDEDTLVDFAHLVELLKERQPGEVIEIRALRNQTQQEFQVHLGAPQR